MDDYCLLYSSTASAYSSFRVNPWQMLLHLLSSVLLHLLSSVLLHLLSSVSLLLSFPYNSVLIRGYVSACSSFRVFPCSSVAMLLLGFPSVANASAFTIIQNRRNR